MKIVRNSLYYFLVTSLILFSFVEVIKALVINCATELEKSSSFESIMSYMDIYCEYDASLWMTLFEKLITPFSYRDNDGYFVESDISEEFLLEFLRLKKQYLTVFDIE